MFLAYDGLVFDGLFLDGWQIEADQSSDGVDFLRWHMVIDVTCVLNWAATSAYKFPKQTKGAGLKINRKRAAVPETRLKAKQGRSTAHALKSGGFQTGQIAGEDTRKTIASVGFNSIPFVGNVAKILPSGVVYADPRSYNALTYNAWDSSVKGIKFSTELGQQRAPVFTDPVGGPTETGSAEVSPSSTQTDSNSKSLLPGVVTGIQIGLGVAGFGFVGLGVPPIGGAIAIGEAVGKAASSVISGSWWGEVQKQLEELGDMLGITKDDIFGGGRQPLKDPKFPTPPVKRNLNSPPPQADTDAGMGYTVPITFLELENRLNKPRRPLAIWLNSGPNGEPEYMLYSPYVGFTTDALHGPKCTMMHMPAIHGNVTGILKLRFETWIAPPPAIFTGKQLVKGNVLISSGTDSTLKNLPGNAGVFKGGVATGQASQAIPVDGGNGGGAGFGGLFGGFLNNLVNLQQLAAKARVQQKNIGTNNIVLATPPIVSNRWTMRQTPDPGTQLNTTIIEGTAHFRLDILQALQLTPDQLRPFFMHPIPSGYVRMPPEVTVLSDGASVQYTIVDVQQMMNNPGGQRWGIHSVKAQQTMAYNSPVDFVRTPFAIGDALKDAGKLGLFGNGLAGKQ